MQSSIFARSWHGQRWKLCVSREVGYRITGGMCSSDVLRELQNWLSRCMIKLINELKKLKLKQLVMIFGKVLAEDRRWLRSASSSCSQSCQSLRKRCGRTVASSWERGPKKTYWTWLNDIKPNETWSCYKLFAYMFDYVCRLLIAIGGLSFMLSISGKDMFLTATDSKGKFVLTNLLFYANYHKSGRTNAR